MRWTTFCGEPVRKLSRQTTSTPRSSRLSQRWLPRKPAPPVTTAREIVVMPGRYPRPGRPNPSAAMRFEPGDVDPARFDHLGGDVYQLPLGVLAGQPQQG